MKQFKYEQLANALKQKIDDNVWFVDEKLPSIRTLASTYCLAKISVQKALQTLEARGVIYAKSKSGYYVAQNNFSPSENVTRHKVALKNIKQPKLVDMPNVLIDIMQRSAAFDIAPQHQITANEKPSNHLVQLNRHIGRELRKNSQAHALYYADPTGDLTLREQICLHYRKRNVYLSPDDVCITAGCQNSLYLSLVTTCEPGDIVAIESPAFYGVLQLLQQLKLKAVELPSSPTLGVSASTLEQALAKWPIKVCVLTPNYATPTGATIPMSEKEAMVKLASAHNITLIEDDIYGDLGFYQRTVPLKHFDVQGSNPQENVILCGSLSKSLSRDLRLGWIVSKKHHQAIVYHKLIHQLSSNQTIQNGVASFLAQGSYERHLDQYRKTLLNQRDQLVNAIKSHWKLPTLFTVPDGGLALWITLDNKIDTLTLYHQAITKGIVITPGRLFSNSNQFQHQLRLSFAHPCNGHRLDALKQLGQLIKHCMS